MAMMGGMMATGAVGGGMAGIGSYFARKGTRKRAPKPKFDPVSKYEKALSFLTLAPQYLKIMGGEQPWYSRAMQQAGINQAMRSSQMTGQKMLMDAGMMGQGGELGTLKTIRSAREAGLLSQAPVTQMARMQATDKAMAGLQNWSMLQPRFASAKGRRGPGLVSSMHAGGFTGLGQALSSGGASQTQNQINQAMSNSGGGTVAAGGGSVQQQPMPTQDYSAIGGAYQSYMNQAGPGRVSLGGGGTMPINRFSLMR